MHLFLISIVVLMIISIIIYNNTTNKEYFSLFQEGNVSITPLSPQEKDLLNEEEKLDKEEKEEEKEKEKEEPDGINNDFFDRDKSKSDISKNSNYLLKSSIVPYVQPTFGYEMTEDEKKKLNKKSNYNPLLPNYNNLGNEITDTTEEIDGNEIKKKKKKTQFNFNSMLPNSNNDDDETLIQKMRSFLKRHDTAITDKMDKPNSDTYVKNNNSGKQPLTKYEKAYEIMNKKDYNSQKQKIVEKNTKCPACAPCGQCPDPAYECKMVPNYKFNAVQPSSSVSYSGISVPRPMLNSFSTFAM